MSQELIYTSAPSGLKPGSRGFCTVCSTQGMLPNLAERLESLSGYRQAFAPQDSQAALNPVVWSHLRLAVGGRPYHVLSRIAAAGLDYSQRSNKLAHHVVLDPSELVSAGPAALLSRRGFMETAWSGQPRLVPAGRRPPPLTASASVCRAWQDITGDAGWGGVLAESLLAAGNRPTTIIFRPGMELLPLLAESLALLPAARRWQVTFSTYCTALPPGIDCQVRGALDGSPEATAARRAPQGVIDLCRPLPAAVGGSLVAAARGEALPAVGPRVPSAKDADIDELARLLDEPAAARRAAGAMPGQARSPALESWELTAPPPPMEPGFVYRRKFAAKRAATWPVLLGVSAGLLFATGTGVAWYVAQLQREAEIAQRIENINGLIKDGKLPEAFKVVVEAAKGPLLKENGQLEETKKKLAQARHQEVYEAIKKHDVAGAKSLYEAVVSDAKTLPALNEKLKDLRKSLAAAEKNYIATKIVNINGLIKDGKLPEAFKAVVAAAKDPLLNGNDQLEETKKKLAQARHQEVYEAIKKHDVAGAKSLYEAVVSDAKTLPALNEKLQDLRESLAAATKIVNINGLIKDGKLPEAFKAVVAAAKDPLLNGNDQLEKAKKQLAQARHQEVYEAMKHDVAKAKSLYEAVVSDAKTLPALNEKLQALRESLAAAEIVESFNAIPSAVEIGAPPELAIQDAGSGAIDIWKSPPNAMPGLDLALIGGKAVLSPNLEFRLKESTNPATTTSARTWSCELALSGRTVADMIGEFVFSDGALKFKWGPRATRNINAKLLRNCLIKVTLSAGGQPRVIALRRSLVESGKPALLRILKTDEHYVEHAPTQDLNVPDLPVEPQLEIELLGIDPIQADQFTAVPNGGHELKIVPINVKSSDKHLNHISFFAAAVPDKKKANVCKFATDFGMGSDFWKDLPSDPLVPDANASFSPMFHLFRELGKKHASPHSFDAVIAAYNPMEKQAKVHEDELTARLKKENRGPTPEEKKDRKQWESNGKDARNHKDEAKALKTLSVLLFGSRSNFKLRFRIWMTVDDQRVLLVASDDDAAQYPADKKQHPITAH